MNLKFLQLHSETISRALVAWGAKLGIALIILLAFLVAGRIVKRVVCRIGARDHPHREQILILIGAVAKIALQVIGVITALGTLGINVSALVAGLGLTGFALGFAFRDALSNVLAGIMILMYRPFERGDHATVLDLDGEVTGIDLRYTTLRDKAKNKTYLIPNSLLLTNAISLTRS